MTFSRTIMCSEWRGDIQDFILVFTLCYRKILRMHVPGGWKMLSYSGTWTLEKSISQIVWLHGSWNNVAMLNARLVCGECNWRRSPARRKWGRPAEMDLRHWRHFWHEGVWDRGVGNQPVESLCAGPGVNHLAQGTCYLATIIEFCPLVSS